MGHPDRHIRLQLSQVGKPVRQFEVERDTRIAVRKGVQIGRQKPLHDRIGQADLDPAIEVPVAPSDIALRLEHLVFHPLGRRQEVLAGLGRHQPRTRPVEQSGSEGRFQPHQSTIHGGVVQP